VLHEQKRNIYGKTLPQQQKDGVILWRVVSGLAIDPPVVAIEECHVRQRGAVCPAICREDAVRI
jgi:hypothetical protein